MYKSLKNIDESKIEESEQFHDDGAAAEKDDEFQNILIPQETMNQTGFMDKNDIPKQMTVADFLSLVDSGDPSMDTTFGVRKHSRDEYKIGSERFDYLDKKIYVKGKPYPETPGLLELLFKKNPNEELIKDSDIVNYQNMAIATNLLKKICSQPFFQRSDL